MTIDDTNAPPIDVTLTAAERETLGYALDRKRHPELWAKLQVPQRVCVKATMLAYYLYPFRTPELAEAYAANPSPPSADGGG